MIEWFFIGWVMVGGVMHLDKGIAPTLTTCLTAGEVYLSIGEAGDFRCIFQQEV